MNTHQLLLCLGTNVEQEFYMATAKSMLVQVFDYVVFSRWLWTVPIGHASPLYLNALAHVKTTLLYDEASRLLKDLEQRLGRTRNEKYLHRVTIDIDILQFDNTVFHADDWERYYVKQLAQELKNTISEWCVPSIFPQHQIM